MPLVLLDHNNRQATVSTSLDLHVHMLVHMCCRDSYCMCITSAFAWECASVCASARASCTLCTGCPPPPRQSSFEASAVGTAGGGGGAASEPPISLLGKHVAFVDLDNMAGALDDITDQFDVLFAYAGASYNGPLPRVRVDVRGPLLSSCSQACGRWCSLRCGAICDGVCSPVPALVSQCDTTKLLRWAFFLAAP